LVSGTLAVSTTTLQSRVGTRYGCASGAGSSELPLDPRAGATLDDSGPEYATVALGTLAPVVAVHLHIAQQKSRLCRLSKGQRWTRQSAVAWRALIVSGCESG